MMPSVLRQKYGPSLTSDLACALESYLEVNGISASQAKDSSISLVTLLPSLQATFKRWRDVTPGHLKKRDHALVKQLNAWVLEFVANEPKVLELLRPDTSSSDAQPDDATDQSRNDEPASVDLTPVPKEPNAPVVRIKVEPGVVKPQQQNAHQQQQQEESKDKAVPRDRQEEQPRPSQAGVQPPWEHSRLGKRPQANAPLASLEEKYQRLGKTIGSYKRIKHAYDQVSGVLQEISRDLKVELHLDEMSDYREEPSHEANALMQRPQ
jgi:hypothetical protein